MSLMVVGLLISTAVALWIVWAYLERSKPNRIRKSRREMEISSKDQTHNIVVATKSIINIKKNKGSDVRSAEILAKRAEMALEAGDREKAKRLAEEAREELNSVKSTPIVTSAPVKKQKKEELSTLDLAQDKEIKKDLIESREKVERLPDNYLESKFEIDIARGLCEKKGTPEANKLLSMAEICYGNEDYTDALKYAVQSKKAIDESESGLLSAQKIGAKKNVSKVEEVREITIKESSTEGLKCPECSNAVREDDKFCNLCGEKLSFPVNCPGCGVEVSPEQNFCSECGTELDESEFECPECGSEIYESSKFCPVCGVEFSE